MLCSPLIIAITITFAILLTLQMEWTMMGNGFPASRVIARSDSSGDLSSEINLESTATVNIKIRGTLKHGQRVGTEEEVLMPRLIHNWTLALKSTLNQTNNGGNNTTIEEKLHLFYQHSNSDKFKKCLENRVLLFLGNSWLRETYKATLKTTQISEYIYGKKWILEVPNEDRQIKPKWGKYDAKRNIGDYSLQSVYPIDASLLFEMQPYATEERNYMRHMFHISKAIHLPANMLPPIVVVVSVGRWDQQPHLLANYTSFLRDLPLLSANIPWIFVYLIDSASSEDMAEQLGLFNTTIQNFPTYHQVFTLDVRSIIKSRPSDDFPFNGHGYSGPIRFEIAKVLLSLICV